MLIICSCSTGELYDTLLGVDIWINIDRSKVNGTELFVTEVTEISFRDSILKKSYILEGDTVSHDEFKFSWRLKYPNKIKHNLSKDQIHGDLKVVDYNNFELKLTGLSPWEKQWVFTPKIR